MGGRAVGAAGRLGRAPLNCCCSGRRAAQPACGPGMRNRRAAGSRSWERPTGQNCGERLSGGTDEAELSGVLSGYDDWVMYDTFAK